MVGPYWDPTWTAVCPAQSAERPDIGQAEVERYRQQLEKAREQPEAILVLEVTWVCHWRNRGKPPDFIRFHGWLYHFPSFSQWFWPLFLGDTPNFQTNPPNGSVVVPIPGARTEFGGHFISCHRADRMLKLRLYGDGLLVCCCCCCWFIWHPIW